MSAVTKLGTNPMADLKAWLGSDLGLGFPAFGEVPLVRIEDYMDDGNYVLRAELPGIDPEKDLEITVSGDQLTIRGERSEESRDREHSEFHYGAFSRSVQLPKGSRSDEIDAQYRGGVLEVHVPVDEKVQSARKISVTHSES